MTQQPHLWDTSTATITSRQPRLFDPNAVEAGDTPLVCCTCGRPMVRTESGYLCCPAGHGKLIAEEVEDGDPDPATEAALCRLTELRTERDLLRPEDERDWPGAIELAELEAIYGAD
jgi:hypothetical protein